MLVPPVFLCFTPAQGTRQLQAALDKAASAQPAARIMLLATLSNLLAKDEGVAFLTSSEARLGQVVDLGVAALGSERMDERLGASALLLNLSMRVPLEEASGEGPSRAAVTMLLGGFAMPRCGWCV